MENQFDVTSLGATMLRLSVPPGERLETAPVYEIHSAGAESNTMAAMARMGKRTAWLSRLTDNPIGRRISREIAYHEVDVSRVIWTTEDRNGIFFVEFGTSPRGIHVTYDRKHSAVSNIAWEEIDLDFILSSRILHLTGIFAALSDNCAAVEQKLMDCAKKAGVTISFDVNYRAKLWSPVCARQVLTPMMQMADILFITQEDADNVFGITGSAEQVVTACYRTFGPELCIVTLGNEGGIAYDGSQFYLGKGYDAQVIDRLGAGDCFAAGVLCGYLEGSVQTGMDYGSAMAALKLSVRGDYFTSDKAEVMGLLDSTRSREVKR